MFNIIHFIAQRKIENTQVGVPEVVAGQTAIDAVLTIVFTAAGSIALLFVVIGALRYVMSSGEQAKTKQAKDTVLYALIGLVVTFISFIIVQVVLGVLYG